ncbi:MAG TPA: folate-binding protein [Opitutaceae bacterium]
MKISPSFSVFSYRPAAFLRASGPDAAAFLQGQFTNDLRKLDSERALYGLWLDRKGRVLADSQILKERDSEDFLISSMLSPAATLAARLGDHIIADDVAIADETVSWRGLALIGAGTGAWLAAEPRPGFVFPGRRVSGENWEWIHRESDAAAVQAAVEGAGVVGAAEIERLRIASGIPSVPFDIGPSDLPNEGGLDAVAISYSKGCYTGQEVMARIKSLGRVRRTLVRVRGASAPPVLPAGLWLGGRKEGELRSAVPEEAGFAGLALVSVAAAAAGGPLSLGEGPAPAVEIVRGP